MGKPASTQQQQSDGKTSDVYLVVLIVLFTYL